MASLHFTEGFTEPPRPTSIPRQLLPNIVDGLAQARPYDSYALIPESFTTHEAGYRKVTWRDFANAVNGAAWLLHKELGSRVEGKGEVLTYVGPNDIGYIIYILAAVKAGHTVLSVGPRNTKADHAALFSASKCKTLLTLAPPYSTTVDTILEGVTPRPRIIHVPTIFELLDGKYEHYPYPKNFESAKDESLVKVQTSGTTGTPKLITYTHAFAAAVFAWSQELPPRGYENVMHLARTGIAFTTFPFFHAGGIQISLLSTIATNGTLMTPLAGIPPSAAGIIEAIGHVKPDVINLPSPFAEQISKSPEMLEIVASTVSCITYGGGDVSEACANAFLQKGVRVAGFNGSTETTAYPILRPLEGWEVGDLKYIQPHPVANIHFEPAGVDGLFEAVLMKNQDSSKIQPVFEIFKDLGEFRTKDLFEKHGTKEGLWLYKGRGDDMIVSATTVLCNPVPFEQAVGRAKEVAAALMVGTGRYQKALIVEPAEEVAHEDETSFVDRIWPAIQEANQGYPDNSQIFRSHIMLTEARKTLPRTGKGTVQRTAALKLYKREIDQLYEREGDGVGDRAERPFRVHVEMGGR